MTKQILLNPQQRAKELIKLIQDAKEMRFNPSLIQNYTKQLNEVQATIKADKEKRLSFNRIERGLN